MSAAPIACAAPQQSLRGHALVLGDHVNADLLHPPAFFSLDATRVRAGFLAGIVRDDEASADGARWIIVAGRNFGCGSSRETTVDALRRGGAVAVVAPSFGRIFQRTAAALGLCCFTSKCSLTGIQPGAELVLDPSGPSLLVAGDGRPIELARPDPFLEAVYAAGGLLEWLGRRQ